jgi:hypothetical protein
MAAHTISIPHNLIGEETVLWGETLEVKFTEDVTYHYTHTCAAAFHPNLPFGTFYSGDNIGKYTANSQNCDVTLIFGRESFLIKIRQH